MNSGIELDRLAKQIQSERRVSYSEAIRIAMRENTQLAREYSSHGNEGTDNSPRRSYGIQAYASEKLDERARSIMSRNGSNYRDAFAEAAKEMPRTLAAWDSGIMEVKNYDQLSSSDQMMLRALRDPTWIRTLAGSLLDSHATNFAGAARRGGQVNPDSYRQALQDLIRQFPDLGEAADTGKIDSSNWALLATLVPSLSSEIKNKFGVDGYNLRSGNYSSSQGSRVYHDRNNNEFRRYDL